jgi:UDP-glucuronate 4-epimerase
MRILITGGAGFIGSHLSERLLGEGHELALMDNFDPFYDAGVKRANLKAVRKAGEFEFHEADIRDSEAAPRIFERFRPEAVIHLAAKAGVRPSIEDPLGYEATNVRGTMILLEAARRNAVGKFLFTSSSSVYGNVPRVPFREDDHEIVPISPYAATKMAGEKVCYTYSHLYGLPVICLRLFTVYGPRQRPDLAIHKFTRLIEAGKPIPFFGDGSTSRDYTFIDDIVAGYLAALRYDCRFDIFNLGNSSPVSLSKLVELIESSTGRRAAVDRQPAQPGDVERTYADITKAGRLLGYHPATPLRTGIARFVEWFRFDSTCAA